MLSHSAILAAYCPAVRSACFCSASNLAIGPDLSAISLRLGARGEYELAARGAVLFVPFENTTLYMQFGVAFSYLLLGG